MAIALVTAPVGTSSATEQTSSVIDLPAGCDVVGRALWVAFIKDGTAVPTWPAGWTAPTNGAGDLTATANRIENRYQIIDGSQGYPATGAQITITHASEATRATAWLINDEHDLQNTAAECATVEGTDANPNPPSLSPSWGSGTTSLFLAIAGRDDSGNASVFPAGYGNTITGVSAGAAGNVSLYGASKVAAASPEDPGTFTAASDTWRAFTVAIKQGLYVATSRDPMGMSGFFGL